MVSLPFLSLLNMGLISSLICFAFSLLEYKICVTYFLVRFDKGSFSKLLKTTQQKVLSKCSPFLIFLLPQKKKKKNVNFHFLKVFRQGLNALEFTGGIATGAGFMAFPALLLCPL